MLKFIISLGLGLVAACIDIAPMIAKKLDKSFIFSAFSIWVVLGLIIPSTKLIPVSWLNGAVVALLCILPIVILVTKLDKQAIPIMILSAIILGSLIGFLSKLLIK